MEYTVSIRLMTYNHEPFIRKAMDGIMMQEIEFPVEVIIGDDFSNDKTLSIIKEYKSSANIHLKILKRKKGDNYWKLRQKKGRLFNFIDILENCTGKYIALLDGDDYWTDPLKLHKQVNIMENSHSVGLVHTAYDIYLNEEEKIQKERREYSISKNWPTAKELLLKNRIATLTTLFRKSILDEIFPSYKKILFDNNWPMADYPLWLLISNNNEIRYLNEVTGVYRKRGGSLSAHSNFSDRKLFFKKTFQIQKYFGQRFKFSIETIKSIEKAHILKLFNLAWKFNEWDYILKYYGKLEQKELNVKHLLKYLLALVIKYSGKLRKKFTN